MSRIYSLAYLTSHRCTPAEAIRIVAMQAGSPLFQRGEHWDAQPVDPLARSPASVSYVDEQGRFIVHGSALHGRHQAANLGLARGFLPNRAPGGGFAIRIAPRTRTRRISRSGTTNLRSPPRLRPCRG